MLGLFKSKDKEPEKLFFSTDIHCHVIPGIDDGSHSLDLSIELLERMHSWGLSTIIATPHVTQDTFENSLETITPPYNALNEAIAAKGLDIKLLHSAEYRIDENSLAQIEKGIVMPYPNKYLLVENSFLQEPWGLKNVFFDLMLKDFRLIWAHPERYTYYYPKEKRQAYDEYHAMGVAFQINLLSLAGHYGKEQKKMAEMLIEKGLVDFIGSDLHNHRHADSIEAYLKSKDYRHHRDMLQGRIKNDTAFE